MRHPRRLADVRPVIHRNVAANPKLAFFLDDGRLTLTAEYRNYLRDVNLARLGVRPSA